MTFEELLQDRKCTVYKLSKESGIGKTTIYDIASGKSNIMDCSGRVLQSISKALNVTIEELLTLDSKPYNPAYETNVPEYLKRSIKNYKVNLRKKSSLLDCYYCELYSDINSAEVDNLISRDHAEYLRDKYLR